MAEQSTANLSTLQDGFIASPEQFSKIYRNPSHEKSSRKSYIRLFTINPGKGDDRISGTLSVASLHQFPKYETISYTWGEGTRMKRIKVNAEVVSIRYHLWQMLVQVRRHDKPRVLWIDALCIRQDSIAEKNYMVQRIGRIFDHSRRTLIWLGPHAQDSDNLLSLILDLESSKNLVYLKWEAKERTEKFLRRHLPSIHKKAQIYTPPNVKDRKQMLLYAGFEMESNLEVPPLFIPAMGQEAHDIPGSCFVLSDQYREGILLDQSNVSEPVLRDLYEMSCLRRKAFQAIKEILNRGYFSRTWIIQEIILAKEVLCFCGDLTFSLETMWEGCQIVCNLLMEPLGDFRDKLKLLDENGLADELDYKMMRQILELHPLARLLDLRQTYQSKREGLDNLPSQGPISILSLAHGTKCKDPRDKVYALLSLLNDSSQLGRLQVDYSIETFTLFEGIIFQIGAPQLDFALDFAKSLLVSSEAMIEQIIHSTRPSHLAPIDEVPRLFRKEETITFTAWLTQSYILTRYSQDFTGQTGYNRIPMHFTSWKPETVTIETDNLRYKLIVVSADRSTSTHEVWVLRRQEPVYVIVHRVFQSNKLRVQGVAVDDRPENDILLQSLSRYGKLLEGIEFTYEISPSVDLSPTHFAALYNICCAVNRTNLEERSTTERGLMMGPGQASPTMSRRLF